MVMMNGCEYGNGAGVSTGRDEGVGGVGVEGDSRRGTAECRRWIVR